MQHAPAPPLAFSAQREAGRPRKLSASPDLFGTVLPCRPKRKLLQGSERFDLIKGKAIGV
ncbi:hypothetical protein C1884_16695 [Pseudomonas sp. GW460-R15]|nr:hypothetical protein C1887_05330 [Pseudomonas sp. GW456-R21]POA65926.1 hypothetical protein C1884_16695 [Pseudomonas sp. GW460-R15]